MKGIALVTIIFSVVIPIQSHEIINVYNYVSFGEIFPQSYGGFDEFHLYKYADIDIIFDTEYKGTNIGGAFLVHGTNWTETHFDGYVIDITATFYCGSTETEEGGDSLWIGVRYPDGNIEGSFICQERGWHYNHTWIPPSGAIWQNFTVIPEANFATINRAYGFDELRITTSDTPPQLLQRDNISSNERPLMQLLQ